MGWRHRRLGRSAASSQHLKDEGLAGNRLRLTVASLRRAGGAVLLAYLAIAGSANASSPAQYVATPPADAVGTYPLSSVTDLPGGGESYNFAEGNGGTFSLLVPPAGFDPTTATDQQLNEYAFPPRPNPLDTAAYAQWAGTVGEAVPVQVPSSLFALGARHDRVTSQWGGWIADGSQNTFTSEETDYTEPHITESSCPSGQDGSFWSGIGGFNSNDGYVSSLGQDGTDYDGGTDHYAWAEVVGANGGNVMNTELPISISAGNAITDYTKWDPTNLYYGGFVENDTTHGEMGWQQYVSGGNAWTGDSAESIVERTGSAPLPPLPNYGSLAMSDVINGSWHFGHYPNERWTMKHWDAGSNSWTYALESTGDLTSGGFTTTWLSCS